MTKHTEHPASNDPQDINNHSGYHIRRAYTRFSKIFSEYARRFALKSQQVTILTSVRDFPGVNPATIADEHSVERSLVTMLVGDLVKRGLIEKRDVNADKRRKGLFLTTAGNEFINELMHQLYFEMEPDINTHLTFDEKNTLIHLLKKMYGDEL